MASAFQPSPRVGLLHSTIATGSPLMKTATSGMIFFLLPITPNCRVTTNSFLAGSSKSMKRTVWPFLPSPRSWSSAMPWVMMMWTRSLASIRLVAWIMVTVRTALARLSSDSQRFRRLRAAASRLLSTTSLNDSRSASRTSGGT